MKESKTSYDLFWEAERRMFEDFMAARAQEQSEFHEVPVRYKNFEEIRAAIRNRKGCSMRLGRKLSEKAKDAFAAIANLMCAGRKHITVIDVEYAMDDLHGEAIYSEFDADDAIDELMVTQVTLKWPPVSAGEYTCNLSDGMLFTAEILEAIALDAHEKLLLTFNRIPKAIELAETGTIDSTKRMLEGYCFEATKEETHED